MGKDFRNVERDREVADAGRVTRNALGFTAVLGWAFSLAARESLKAKPASPWFFKTIGWLGVAAGAASTLGFFSAAKTIQQAKRKMEEAANTPAADFDNEVSDRHVHHLHHSKHRGRSR